MAKLKQGKPAKQPVRASRHWGWLLVLGAVVMFLGIATVDLWRPGGARNPLAAASPQEVARGAGLYRKFCQECHGVNGQGENPLTPMGGSKPGGSKPGGGYLAPALNERGHAHHHPPDVLYGYLRNGSPAADSPMRSLRDKMTEADMQAVLGYVWSLWPPPLQQNYARAHGL
jgi:mono/diheme cytochrome c family protein